jgi:adenylate cyclase
LENSRSEVMAASQRRLAAIVFTDMVGYSALAQADEGSALEVLARHNRLLRPVFAKHGGREVKTIGDAFLIEFDSALDATNCSLEIQRVLHDYNASAADTWKIRIRIGIHVGDVVESNGDVLGDAVNIASRIEPLAEPEGICVTQQVFDQIQNKVTLPLAKLPPTILKNIHLPVSVYRFVQPWDPRRTVAPETDSSAGRHLAVLPLANISPDPADGYFADGLTEELISVLSQVPGLCVIARTSVVPYKTQTKSIAQIGSELNVDTVLEGSVRKSGNHLRITLQLIDVSDQQHIWATTYNREVDDVFAVQTDIAERTAEALRLELKKSGRRSAGRPPTESREAYDAYLRGLVAMSGIMPKDLDEAIRSFEEATRLDPSFAEAFAVWADLYVRVSSDILPMRQVMPRARELAARAVALDPNSSEAHATLGNIALQFDLDWARAEAEFETAIELNPSNVTAHRFYALLMMSQERFDEAKELFRRLIRLDPSGEGELSLAWADYEAGNMDEAIRAVQRGISDEPSKAGFHTMLGMFLFGAGRVDDARREADKPLPDPSFDDRFDRALLDAMVGRPEPAREILRSVEHGESKNYVSDSYLAMFYSALGEKERALDLLEKDFREGDRVLWLWYRGVYFDPIRGDPRFSALLKRYGLPIRPIRGWTPSPELMDGTGAFAPVPAARRDIGSPTHGRSRLGPGQSG